MDCIISPGNLKAKQVPRLAMGVVCVREESPHMEAYQESEYQDVYMYHHIFPSVILSLICILVSHLAHFVDLPSSFFNQEMRCLLDR
jgi:hypothetical protein